MASLKPSLTAPSNKHGTNTSATSNRHYRMPGSTPWILINMTRMVVVLYLDLLLYQYMPCQPSLNHSYGNPPHTNYYVLPNMRHSSPRQPKLQVSTRHTFLGYAHILCTPLRATPTRVLYDFHRPPPTGREIRTPPMRKASNAYSSGGTRASATVST